ncbi:PREDICTED: uncharacterized protein LOC109340282 [Lupinus angustifolius]|uniref:uncharacterized protein LOC109340282 n=1 Tax=Lupinus angustifolius TaxID=3871 RepID=UPI00092E4FB8|nr:PREDICTED: uncharacterized protein LOC109340282 [Lupinus angustifolius]
MRTYNIPKGKKVIFVKWVYKVKLKPDGTIAKYKAKLVTKEFLTDNWILMHQEKYIFYVLIRFNMLECNSTSTQVETGNILCKGVIGDQFVDSTLYRKLIRSLRYICNSRPDLDYGVGIVRRYMEDPRHSHKLTIKRLVRYLKGSMDYGVLFPVDKNEEPKTMYGDTNVDWCSNKNDRKNTIGYLF